MMMRPASNYEGARSEEDRAAFVEPSFFSQAGLFLTFRCTIGCAHCMVAAGPHRTEEMDVAEAAGWLTQLAVLDGDGVTAIGFTGGEPLCCRDKLFGLAAQARRLGLPFTIVTNGYWARSQQETRYLLSELSPIAVRVSTDAYHSDYIPLQHVERIYLACRELNIACDIAVAYSSRTLLVTRAIISRLLTFAPAEAIRTTRLLPGGRGDHRQHYSSDHDPNLAASDTPCLFASVPYILPNGDVFACIGPALTLPQHDHPLYLGSLRTQSLHDIRTAAEQNAMLHGLRLWGPRFWHRLIERRGPRETLPRGYYSNSPCEGCVTLLRNRAATDFLARAGKSADLQRVVARARRETLGEETPALDAHGY
ncbi:MAG: radical SAM protein [candidate division Zixibacteria bacterium]|nr:radical SAM protein [candidate division Zixibacteria bacterium]